MEYIFVAAAGLLTAICTITEIILDHKSPGLISIVIIACVLNMGLMYLMISNFKDILERNVYPKLNFNLDINYKLIIASIIYFTILLVLLPLIALTFQPWYLWSHLLYGLLFQLLFILIVCITKYLTRAESVI